MPIRLVRPQVVVEVGAAIDPIKMSESKAKLGQILKKSFEEPKGNKEIEACKKEKTKL